MKKYLESQNIKPDHAQKIVQFIYDSPILNRYNYEQIIKFLKKSKLTILKIEESMWGAPDKKNADILKTIAAKNNKKKLHFLYFSCYLFPPEFQTALCILNIP